MDSKAFSALTVLLIGCNAQHYGQSPISSSAYSKNSSTQAEIPANFDKQHICLEAAASVTKTYEAIQKLARADPSKQPDSVWIEQARKWNFDQYKKDVSQHSDLAVYYDTLRLEREWGISEYEANPQLTKDAVERDVYSKCISGRK
jgi:hypothetical protein